MVALEVGVQGFLVHKKRLGGIRICPFSGSHKRRSEREETYQWERRGKRGAGGHCIILCLLLFYHSVSATSTTTTPQQVSKYASQPAQFQSSICSVVLVLPFPHFLLCSVLCMCVSVQRKRLLLLLSKHPPLPNSILKTLVLRLSLFPFS